MKSTNLCADISRRKGEVKVTRKTDHSYARYLGITCVKSNVGLSPCGTEIKVKCYQKCESFPYLWDVS